ncbi:MAG TPA: serine hydrolase [Fimbriiglobus sp.]|nr:serine hydrolase [Fimbriiglobus sp.]
MSHWTVTVIGILVLAVGPVTGANPSHDFDSAGVDHIVGESLKRWEVPGVALAIVRGEETVHLKGYGTKRVGVNDPVTPDTLFPLASCTKAFTSTLTAILADDGKLAWDDQVGKHLPGFHLSDPNADALVTLRDLLTHRTGVAGHDLLWYRAPWDADEVIRRIAHVPVTGRFRGDYHYTSLMYMAAGRAAARAAGSPWETLVRDRICTPLGMSGVAFTTAEAEKAKDRATGHRRTKGGAVEPMPGYTIREPNPAGSLHATARDLSAWLKFHLAGGMVDGKRLVSAANLTETKTPHTVMRKDEVVGPVYPDSHQVSYAMGWAVYDHRGRLVVAHGGVIDGIRVQVTLLPNEKVGFVLLNNLHETKMNIALGNKIIDHMFGLEPKDWDSYFLKVEKDERDAKRSEIERRNKSRRTGTRPSVPLDQFAGEYRDAAYGTGKVTADGGKLVWEWSSFRCPLEHFQDDAFRVTEGYFEDQLVEFAGVNGRPLRLRAMGVVFERK